MRFGRDQVSAWRLERQFVSRVARGGAAEVAGRLAGVQAQVTSAAELAVALRSAAPEPGAVARALEQGALIKTWAMRGTLHAMPPSGAAAVLPLMAATRIWEKPSWQRTFGATPAEVAALTEAVGGILADAVLTREELVEALLADRAFHRMGEELRSGWGALLKPLAWQGALCHGPPRGTKVTFTAPARAVPGWTGLADVDEAAKTTIAAYLGAYGPATPEVFDAWLTRGSLRKALVRGWFADLGDALTPVDIDGRTGYALTEHLDALAATTPDHSAHLLGPFDQYVLGPTTADTDLLPKQHRSAVSRTAGWIAPLVIVSGRIVGTWELDGAEVAIAMFDDAPLPRRLDPALARVAAAAGLEKVSARAA